MNKYEAADYTFLGLCNKPSESFTSPVKPSTSSLVYLVSLVDSVNHPILELSVAHRTLVCTFEMDAATTNAAGMIEIQEGTLGKGLFPQTPAIVTKAWSPISAMLEISFEPLALKRDAIRRAVATGIWSPDLSRSPKIANRISEKAGPLSAAQTSEDLFWAILPVALHRARERGKLLSVVAEPGWHYESSIGGLPRWTDAQLDQADRILWQRTPEG